MGKHSKGWTWRRRRGHVWLLTEHDRHTGKSRLLDVYNFYADAYAEMDALRDARLETSWTKAQLEAITWTIEGWKTR